jgi:hypothetical protein
VGTKRDEFEESTKVKSSAEISEMLRNAGVQVEPEDDFESDAHTQVGNISELIAKSREMGDVPASTRASANVIRRTQTPIAIERVAIGSQSDIPAKTDDKTDDEAFEEMLSAAPQAQPEVEVDLEVEADVEEPLALPPPPSGEMLVVRPMPQIAVAAKTRWGVIAWVVLLLVTIGLGTMSYMKIAQLEDELAMTRAQIKP